MQKKSVTIRMDEALLKRLRVIAARESRSLNGQMFVIARRCVEEYEARHGPVLPEEERPVGR